MMTVKVKEEGHVMIKNMKIGRRLLLSFIIIALLASIAGIASVSTIRNLNDRYHAALTDYGFIQGDIGKAMLMLTDSRRCVRDIVNSTERKEVEKAQQELGTVKKKYEGYAENVKNALNSMQAKEDYEQIAALVDQYTQIQQEILELRQSEEPQAKQLAERMVYDRLDPAYQKLYDKYADILTNCIDEGTQQSEALMRLGASSIAVIMVMVAGAFIAAFVLAVAVSRSISRPVQETVEAANQIAAGNLDIELKAGSGDEVGMLAQNFKNMADTLKTIIKDINYLLGEMSAGNFRLKTTCEECYVGDYRSILLAIRGINFNLSQALSEIDNASDQVALGAGQVADTSQIMAQGSAEQASSIEELSAAVSSISEHISKNAENARLASELVSSTEAALQDGYQQMQLMVEAMEKITESSAEIGKIIKTIDDIAFQTNILALNAAVEAARAGNAGKGFAVVAGEVRNLAQKSAQAAKNTTALIEGSVTAVKNGTVIADHTAKSLDEVVASSSGVKGAIQQIAEACAEQSEQVGQINAGMDQIAAVVQNNSATAQESAASSEELSGQARMLKEQVSKFKLRRQEEA